MLKLTIQEASGLIENYEVEDQQVGGSVLYLVLCLHAPLAPAKPPACEEHNVLIVQKKNKT